MAVATAAVAKVVIFYFNAKNPACSQCLTVVPKNKNFDKIENF